MCLLLIGRLLQLRALILGLDLGLFDLARLFFYLSPFFLLLLIPLACLMSVFLVFLRLSSEREMVALKTCGVSLWQLLPAPAAFCVLCALLNLFVSLYGLAWGMDHFRQTVMEYARTRTQLVLQPGIFNREFPGLTLFAEEVDPAEGVIRNVLVLDETNPAVSATILAPYGRVRTDPEQGRLLFALSDGRIYRQGKGELSVLKFDSYLVRLDLTKLLRGQDISPLKPKEMSWTRLRQVRAETLLQPPDDANWTRKIVVEMHKRFALPAACLILGLFAVPLACAFGDLRRQWGALLAFGLVLLYYALFSIGTGMGEAGTLDPLVGMWAPNALFLALGAAGLFLAARERAPHLMDFARRIDWRWRPWRRAA